MRETCERCGISHDSYQEALAIHQAMADVRAWFRTQVMADRVINKPSVRPANAQPVGGPLQGK